MSYNFTPAQVRWEITRLARKSPDFNYKKDSGVEGLNCGVPCLYVFGGSASCIVGQALVNLGVDKEKLLKQEGLPAYTALANLCEEDDKDAQEWIDLVQGRQDVGLAWEAAVYKADLQMQERR